MTNKLLPSRTLAEKKVAVCVTALSKLDSKRPQCRTGRQEYFRDLVGLAQAKKVTVAERKGVRKTVMKGHAKLYSEKSGEYRRRYDLRARVQSASRRRELDIKREEVVEKLNVARAKVQEESIARPPLSLRSALWGPSELEGFARCLHSSDFGVAAALRKRDSACEAPNPMSAVLQEALEGSDVDDEEIELQPVWLSQVAKRREHFEGTAFAFELHGESQVLENKKGSLNVIIGLFLVLLS